MSVTDSSAIAFSNAQIRPMADQLVRNYRSSKLILQNWNAKNLSTFFATSTDIVVDGSPGDGRTPITSADINNTISSCSTIVNYFEANSFALYNQVLKVSVNPN